MSVIAAKDKITIRQGSTFDETWTFYLDKERTLPMPMATWSGRLMIRKDYDTAPILDLASGATPPSSDGLVVHPTNGTVRAYVRDETTAALLHTLFVDEGEGRYTGIFDLELEDTAGQRDAYVVGTALFRREVTKP